MPYSFILIISEFSQDYLITISNFLPVSYICISNFKVIIEFGNVYKFINFYILVTVKVVNFVSWVIRIIIYELGFVALYEISMITICWVINFTFLIVGMLYVIIKFIVIFFFMIVLKITMFALIFMTISNVKFVSFSIV